MKRGNIPVVTMRNLYQAERIISAKALRQDNSVSSKNCQEISVAKLSE